MSTSSSDRRQRPRRPYCDSVFISTLDEPKDTLACQTLDISAEGLRISTRKPLAAGRQIELWIRLVNQPGTFLLRGQIRWSEAAGDGYMQGVEIDASKGDSSQDSQDWKALLMPLAEDDISLKA